MSGTWISQNKILPGAYINFLTNAPLSITLGDKGTVVILQEISIGKPGEMYTITATDKSKYPEEMKNEEKLLVNEALKGAKTVILYNLGPTPHDSSDIDTALENLKTVDFNVLCYPYDGDTFEINKPDIVAWVKAMRNDEGLKMQAVLANYAADDEGIINVVQGVELVDGTILQAAQATAWVAGVTAGAYINQSNTGRKYVGAIDVIPRMTKTEMENAIKAGEFIFKVDTVQNVTAVYDINSLTSVTVDKNKKFTKNRFIRTNDGINNDIDQIFESNFKGKVDNEPSGRSIQRATYIDYFNELQRIGAIQNFTAEDVIVEAGTDADAVVVTCYIQQVDATEKMYMTVNLI